MGLVFMVWLLFLVLFVFKFGFWVWLNFDEGIEVFLIVGIFFCVVFLCMIVLVVGVEFEVILFVFKVWVSFIIVYVWEILLFGVVGVIVLDWFCLVCDVCVFGVECEIDLNCSFFFCNWF